MCHVHCLFFPFLKYTERIHQDTKDRWSNGKDHTHTHGHGHGHGHINKASGHTFSWASDIRKRMKESTTKADRILLRCFSVNFYCVLYVFEFMIDLHVFRNIIIFLFMLDYWCFWKGTQSMPSARASEYCFQYIFLFFKTKVIFEWVVYFEFIFDKNCCSILLYLFFQAIYLLALLNFLNANILLCTHIHTHETNNPFCMRQNLLYKEFLFLFLNLLFCLCTFFLQ